MIKLRPRPDQTAWKPPVRSNQYLNRPESDLF